MEGLYLIFGVLALILSIAMLLAILKIPALLREQQRTNRLLAKIARAQGVPETEIGKAFQ